jgi:hypothetical protein
MSQMDMTPSLSRQTSTHGDFAGIFGSDATTMANAEEALVGMQGHTADLVLPQNDYSNLFLGDHNLNRLSILSTTANNLDYNNSNANNSAILPSMTRQSFSTFAYQNLPPASKFCSQPSASSFASSSATTGTHPCPHPNCNTTWPRACDLTYATTITHLSHRPVLPSRPTTNDNNTTS